MTDLQDKLKRLEPDYNPDLKLLLVPNKKTYHTALKMETHPFLHGIYESSVYALNLLDSGIDRYADRAAEILDVVSGLQDRDPASPTYGVWPYFYEESLQQMDIPDWNFADFIGKKIVLAIKRHRDRLPPALLSELFSAVSNACAAIIKRDVGPGYTNIAVMGAFVTLVGGEAIEEASIAEYGLNRIKRLYDYTMRLGTFTEYNSPHYLPITIEELHHIYTETGSPEAVKLTGELIRLAWETIAKHYHPRTGQWSGPHSRSYATMLEPERKEYQFLKEAIGDHSRPDAIRCPDDLLHYFNQEEERHIQAAILDQEEAGYQCYATTFICEAFSLGTFTKEIMWNQRRNLIAYIDNHGKPAYVHLRFIKDGRDCSSAIFTGVQDNGYVLYGINIATDYGDWHPVLDPINGCFEAEDLRIRLEIGGAVDGVEWSAEDACGFDAAITIGGQVLRIKQAAAASDLGVPAFTVSRSAESQVIGVDYIIYSGLKTNFNFHDWDRAAWVYLLSLSESCEVVRTDVHTHNGVLTASCGELDRQIGISLLTKPAGVKALLQGNQIRF
ncbi:hypothetical protein [Paenibacillus alkalitolerans]|uniref:hypothetical protein n=1 Tax=Paenibacillus alkalitolerans TaxID=2799335 RepID=UPI0018F5484D|nr:hypothetical protein [Paenibacillus alkalitolerans]